MNVITTNILNEIVEHKKQEVAAKKQQRPLQTLIEQVTPCTPFSLETAVQQCPHKTCFILEVKPASPSMGVLQEHLDLPPIISAYNQAGVAISVLTDQKYFGGSLSLLQMVSQQTTKPILCKDFILDPYQIYEARLAGASAVLLIVKMLIDNQLKEYTQLIRDLGMTPLIEIQNELELERALAIDPSILLINNRNLETLEIDFNTTQQLAPKIPPSILKISASGIEAREQIEQFQLYCNGFLIGSALMRQPIEVLSQKLQELLG